MQILGTSRRTPALGDRYSCSRQSDPGPLSLYLWLQKGNPDLNVSAEGQDLA